LTDAIAPVPALWGLRRLELGIALTVLVNLAPWLLNR
jgi:hypothetical protein